jgi:hypothetical protein
MTFRTICGVPHAAGKQLCFSKESFPNWPTNITIQRPSEFRDADRADLGTLWSWVCTVGEANKITPDWVSIKESISLQNKHKSDRRKRKLVQRNDGENNRTG